MSCCKCGHIRDVDGLELGEWTVKWRGEPVHLPPVEHLLLKQLTAEPGKLIHWSMIFENHANARMIVCRLRRAMQKVDPSFDKIETIGCRGGWRWAV
jgi:DNA-binding response OmpR family regulator